MSVLSPQDDAKAIQPVLDELEAKAIDAVVERIAPALTKALVDAMDGLTVTVTITRKQ